MSKSKKGQIGHNSATKELMTSVVERVERLEEEKSAIADDIKNVYAEAKGNGLDVRTLREMVKLRGMDISQREEKEYLRDLYMQCLGLGLNMLD